MKAKNRPEKRCTFIYTEYWTCDRIAFVSHEKIIYAVVAGNLQPTHNRYYNYYTVVNAGPHSAYVFPFDSLDKHMASLIIKKISISNQNFRRFVFDGYVVYQPV